VISAGRWSEAIDSTHNGVGVQEARATRTTQGERREVQYHAREIEERKREVLLLIGEDVAEKDKDSILERRRKSAPRYLVIKKRREKKGHLS